VDPIKTERVTRAMASVNQHLKKQIVQPLENPNKIKSSKTKKTYTDPLQFAIDHYDIRRFESLWLPQSVDIEPFPEEYKHLLPRPKNYDDYDDDDDNIEKEASESNSQEDSDIQFLTKVTKNTQLDSDVEILESQNIIPSSELKHSVYIIVLLPAKNAKNASKIEKMGPVKYLQSIDKKAKKENRAIRVFYYVGKHTSKKYGMSPYHQQEVAKAVSAVYDKQKKRYIAYQTTIIRFSGRERKNKNPKQLQEEWECLIQEFGKTNNAKNEKKPVSNGIFWACINRRVENKATKSEIDRVINLACTGTPLFNLDNPNEKPKFDTFRGKLHMSDVEKLPDPSAESLAYPWTSEEELTEDDNTAEYSD